MKFFKKKNIKSMRLPVRNPLKDVSNASHKEKRESNAKIRPNLQLTDTTEFEFGYYPIDVDNNNTVQRLLTNIALDTIDTSETSNLIVTELLKKHQLPVYPKIAPIGGKLVAVNWGQLVDTGGSSNPDHGGIGVPSGAQRWYRQHAPWYAAWYAINPTYQFFVGDNPLFYCYKPVSHIDPESQEPVPTDHIVWKVDGTEVHQGPSFMMQSAPAVEGRKLITMEVHNKMGIHSENTFYEVVEPDDVGRTESTYATYEGQWKFSQEGYINRDSRISSSRVYNDQPIEWEEDPTAFARRIIFAFDWSSMGKGRSKRKRLNGVKPTIKIDGVNINNDQDAMWFNGDKDKYKSHNPSEPKEKSGGWGILKMHKAWRGNKKKTDAPDYSTLKGGAPGGGQLDVTGLDVNTDHRGSYFSAIDQTHYDRGEHKHYHRPLELIKKPGPFDLEVRFTIHWKSFWGRKRRRIYKFKRSYNIDREDLSPVLDLGIITVGYKTQKFKKGKWIDK